MLHLIQIVAGGVAPVVEMRQPGRQPEEIGDKIIRPHGGEPLGHAFQHGQFVSLAQQVVLHGLHIGLPEGDIRKAAALQDLQRAGNKQIRPQAGFHKVPPSRRIRILAGHDIMADGQGGCARAQEAGIEQAAFLHGFTYFGLLALPAVGRHVGPGTERMILVHEFDLLDTDLLGAVGVFARQFGLEHIYAEVRFYPSLVLRALLDMQ